MCVCRQAAVKAAKILPLLDLPDPRRPDRRHGLFVVSGITRGECSSALAAGVNAMLSPKTAAKICQLQVAYTPTAACLQMHLASRQEKRLINGNNDNKISPPQSPTPIHFCAT